MWAGGEIGAAFGASLGPVGSFVGLIVGGAIGYTSGEEAVHGTFGVFHEMAAAEQRTNEVIRKYGRTPPDYSGPAAWIRQQATLQDIYRSTEDGESFWP